MTVSWLQVMFTFASLASLGYAQDADQLGIRLVNPVNSSHEGRVEVFHDGQWGTICDTEWTIEDARVVCTMAGFGTAREAVTDGRYGKSDDLPVVIDHVQCEGAESFLTNCTIFNLNNDTNSKCDMNEVGVFCINVRLVGSSLNLPNGGRVEVFQNGEWGTIRNHGGDWDSRDARVVCRELGYDFSFGSSSCFFESDGTYGQPVWLENVGCFGDEESIFDCWSTPTSHIWHDNDATVACRDILVTPHLPIRLNNRTHTSNTTNGTLFYGNVEVFDSGEWVGICFDGWDVEEADVACRQLGFFGASDEFGVSNLVRGVFRTETRFVSWNCQGNETALSQCPHIVICQRRSAVCKRYQRSAAGAICKLTPEPPPLSAIRLRTNSSFNFEGVVEINYGGVWGTICGDNRQAGWRIVEADVVCRMLGFDTAAETGTSCALNDCEYERFGAVTGPVWINSLSCNGNETSIEQCEFNGPGADCQFSVATVVCDHPKPGASVRLVGGSNSTKGKVEIFLDHQWTSVCSSNFSDIEAAVVCNQLGYFGPANVISGNEFEYNTSLSSTEIPSNPIPFQCKGDEDYLSDCISNNSSQNTCSPSDVVGVECSTGMYTIPVRIVSVRKRNIQKRKHSKGRVEIYIRNRWRTICSSFWTIKDAAVVCRQLGYIGVATNTTLFREIGGDLPPVFSNAVSCAGHENQLADCHGIQSLLQGGVRSNTCNNRSTVAGVICIRNDGPYGVEVASGNGYRGPVEVIINGVSGFLCSDDQNLRLKSAQVICRQLGFTATSDTLQWYQAHGLESPIWLTDINCTGNELYITDCANSGYDRYRRTKACYQYAGVVCSSQRLGFPLRLTINGREEMESEGIALISDLSRPTTWGSICAENWGIAEGQVACRMLGYSTLIQAYSTHFDDRRTRTIIGNVNFSGTEDDLWKCSHNMSKTYDCKDNIVAAVSCADYVPHSKLRLIGGSGPHEGRLEISVGRYEWGAVCWGALGFTDAKIACNQLGYADLVRVAERDEFGIGTTRFLLDNVHCSGFEHALSECLSNGGAPWGYGVNCNRRQSYSNHDEGIVCANFTKTSLPLTPTKSVEPTKKFDPTSTINPAVQFTPTEFQPMPTKSQTQIPTTSQDQVPRKSLNPSTSVMSVTVSPMPRLTSADLQIITSSKLRALSTITEPLPSTTVHVHQFSYSNMDEFSSTKPQISAQTTFVKLLTTSQYRSSVSQLIVPSNTPSKVNQSAPGSGTRSTSVLSSVLITGMSFITLFICAL